MAKENKCNLTPASKNNEKVNNNKKAMKYVDTGNIHHCLVQDNSIIHGK